ncbi:MAG: ParB/RepB/Spo0J family partition protein [Oscillospiraceae bacterium]|nr:ParB/RepB/Spo0J family partition protein [Oscillospiraceae bacterium]
MPVTFKKKNKEINKVVLLPIAQIKSSPGQPRRHFDDNDLGELAQSISANGLLQPITVRKTKDNFFELIAGERRTLACRKLGYETIPAIVEEYSSEQSIILTLIENLQRKDLNYFEEAAGIAGLIQELKLSQQQASRQLGMAQSTVANKLRLLKYPMHIQQEMINLNFSERHARALLRLPDEKSLRQAIAAIKKANLTVEQTEQMIDTLLAKPEAKRGTKIFIIKDMRMFLNSIQKAVATMNQAGIPVDTAKIENDNFVEVHIKIPKASVYRDANRPEHSLCE